MKAHHKDNQVGPNYDFFFFYLAPRHGRQYWHDARVFHTQGGGNNSGTHFFKVTIVFHFFL